MARLSRRRLLTTAAAASLAAARPCGAVEPWCRKAAFFSGLCSLPESWASRFFMKSRISP